MRKFKLLTVMLSLMVFFGLFAACSPSSGSKHTCESVCETCGKCTDAECTEEACAEKCECESEIPTEHTCESVCPECGGCTDEACTETACQNKCSCEEDSEHICESECDECGKCQNEDCLKDACEEKCPGHDLEAIEVSGAKTEFDWGEEFSIGDLEVTAVYQDGRETPITSGYEVDSSAYNKDEPADYEIIVSYGEFTDTYTVTVLAVKAIGIRVECSQDEYDWNTAFDASTLEVYKQYEDESEAKAAASEYTIDASAYDAATSGSYEIVVSFNGTAYQETVTVTVKAAPLVGISLNGYKSEFEHEEEFSFGGTVEAVYADGTQQLLTEEEYEIDSTAYDANVSGDYNIIVSMVGTEFTETYTVTVLLSKVVSISLTSYTTNYLLGGSVDFSALQATGTRKNGETVELTAEDFTFDMGGCDGTTVGTYPITAYYKADTSLFITFTIRVTDKVMRMLAIGDSTMTEEAVAQVPYILDELGYIYEVARVYTNGDCTIDTHYTNATNETANYLFKYFENGTWVECENKNMLKGAKNTLKSAIEYTDWDVITFQQEVGTSGVADSYASLGNLTSYVEENATNESVKFFFNMAWAYGAGYSTKYPNETDFSENYNNDQMTMYNAIVSAVQSEVQTKLNLPIIPIGTAIQNARTSSLGDAGVTLSESRLTKSKGHYIAALMVVATITGEDISNVTYLPANVSATDKKPEKQICIESVKNALANPFTVTNSTYTA